MSATGVAVFAIALIAWLGEVPSIYDLGLVVLGGLVGLVLLGAGIALVVFADLRTDHVVRVAAWNALGVVVLGLVVVLAVASPSVTLPAAVIANVLGVSAVAHVLIGVTDVRRIRVGELARERQKLAVLNRIVRHNLRNDAQVLLANAEALATELTDGSLAGMADTIASKAGGLATLNRKLGRFQAALDHDPGDERDVDLRDTVEEVRWRVLEEHPAGTVEIDLPAAMTVRADDKLADALAELVENAVVHGEGTATVRATRTASGIAITVADDGPGIPEHERGPLDRDTEITQLDHGTGVGLWVVRAVVDAYDGSLRYDLTDGTSVTLEMAAA